MRIQGAVPAGAEVSARLRWGWGSPPSQAKPSPARPPVLFSPPTPRVGSGAWTAASRDESESGDGDGDGDDAGEGGCWAACPALPPGGPSSCLRSSSQAPLQAVAAAASSAQGPPCVAARRPGRAGPGGEAAPAPAPAPAPSAFGEAPRSPPLPAR